MASWPVPGTTTNRVDLIGNAIVVPEEPPNGIETLESDPDRSAPPTRNAIRDRSCLHSNQILDSVQYGIVVEDGLRDLPEYRFFDSADVIKHAQFTHGDYVPHSGLGTESERDQPGRLAPGVTISNNVLAFNGEGGIHFSGDPNGYMLIAPVGHPDQGEVRNGYVFQITDHNGLTVRFESCTGSWLPLRRHRAPFRRISTSFPSPNETTEALPTPCTPDVHLIDGCTQPLPSVAARHQPIP